TNDNGTVTDVTAQRNDAGVTVNGTAGVVQAPSEAAPPGPGWAVLGSGKLKLIDPDKGKILNVTVSAPAEELLTINGRRIACKKIQLAGDEEATQWFAPDGILVRERLRARDNSWVETTLQ